MNTLNRFINYIKVEKRYSEHTVRAYSDDIEQFVQFLNTQHSISDCLIADNLLIRQWLILLINEGMSPRSVRRKIASLNTFYKYCLKNRIIERNPAEGLVLPKLDKNLPEFIKETSIDSLFDPSHFQSDFSGVRDKLVLELFYATGMRLAELVNLKLLDIDFGKSEIKILGKRNKERLVPLTGNIKNLLKEYIKTRMQIENGTSHNKLIITDSGDPAYPRFIQRLVRKYLLRSTTLDKKSPHLLRHTFATHMLNRGADLNAVKELLGHANLAATEIYTHNTYEKLKSIYKQAHPRA